MSRKVSRKRAAPKAVRYGIFVVGFVPEMTSRSALLPKSYTTLKAAQAKIDTLPGGWRGNYTAEPLKAGQR